MQENEHSSRGDKPPREEFLCQDLTVHGLQSGAGLPKVHLNQNKGSMSNIDFTDLVQNDSVRQNITRVGSAQGLKVVVEARK